MSDLSLDAIKKIANNTRGGHRQLEVELARELLEAWEMLEKLMRTDDMNTSAYEAMQIYKELDKYLEGR
jgi:hypothetical protein